MDKKAFLVVMSWVAKSGNTRYLYMPIHDALVSHPMNAANSALHCKAWKTAAPYSTKFKFPRKGKVSLRVYELNPKSLLELNDTTFDELKHTTLTGPPEKVILG